MQDRTQFPRGQRPRLACLPVNHSTYNGDWHITKIREWHDTDWYPKKRGRGTRVRGGSQKVTD